MSQEIKEELKERVLAFIEAQPGYNADEVEEIKITDGRAWRILYGQNIEMGIVGLGYTPDDSFNDFVVKWKSFKGFEWINKTKSLLRI